MKNSLLHEVHHKLGATFGERHEDWNLAVQFTDTVSEHEAVRNGVGIADISYHGTLSLTGEDRAKFLHRLLSNDVENLSDGEGNYTLLLTNRGKIIADMKVHILGEAIYISTAAECTEDVFAELDKYIIADDVELSVETDNFGVIAVYGPKSTELVQSVLNAEESQQFTRVSFPILHVRSTTDRLCKIKYRRRMWGTIFTFQPINSKHYGKS